MRLLKFSPMSAFKQAVRTEKIRRNVSKFYGHLAHIDNFDKEEQNMAKDKETKKRKENKMEQTINERETKPLQDTIEPAETKSSETEANTADMETAENNKTDTSAAEKIPEALKRAKGNDKNSSLGRAAADFMRGLLSGDNPGASLNWVFGFVDNLDKSNAKEYAEYKATYERKYKFAMATLDAIVNYLNDLPNPEANTDADTQAVSKKLEEMSISEVKAWIIDRLKAQTDGVIKLAADKIPEFHSLKEFCVFASRPDAQQPQHMAAMLSLLSDYLKTKPQTLSNGGEMLARMLVSTDVRVIYQRDQNGTVLDNDPEIIVNL